MSEREREEGEEGMEGGTERKGGSECEREGEREGRMRGMKEGREGGRQGEKTHSGDEPGNNVHFTAVG